MTVHRGEKRLVGTYSPLDVNISESFLSLRTMEGNVLRITLVNPCVGSRFPTDYWHEFPRQEVEAIRDGLNRFLGST